MAHFPDGVTTCSDTKKFRFLFNPLPTPKVFRIALSMILAIFFGFMACPASLYAGSTIYIPNQFSNTVSVIDGETLSTVQTISVGQEPYGIGASPDGKTLFVTNMAVDSVSVIDAATNTVKQTIAVGDFPFGAVVSPDGRRLYVANAAEDTLSVIDTESYGVISTINVGDDPHGLVMHPDGSKLYVSNYFGGTVSVINTANNSVVKTISVGTYPHGIAIHPSGAYVYTANVLSDNLSVINTASDTVQTTINTGHYPFVPAVDKSGKNLYVTNYGANSVTVIDVATNSVTATFSVGSAPHGITFDETGARAYVVNEGSNSVSVVDTASRTVITTVPVGKTPIAFGKFVAEPKIPLPSGANVFPGYSGANIPTRDSNPSQSKPLGLGTVAEVGATLDLKIGAYEFASPVDIYLGISMPAIDPSQIYLLTPSGLKPFSSGLTPLKSSVTDISGNLISGYDATLLPTGTYLFYLLTVPAGTPATKLFDNYYLWSTSLSVVRASDVANKAIALFGTDLDAAVAIFLASDKGYTIRQIIDAIDAGTLSIVGEIQDAGYTSLGPMAGKWGGAVADKYCAHLDPTELHAKKNCAQIIYTILEELEEGNDLDNRAALITLIFKDLGYTSSQIDNMAMRCSCCLINFAKAQFECCSEDGCICNYKNCWPVEPEESDELVEKIFTETTAARCPTTGTQNVYLPLTSEKPSALSQTLSQVSDIEYDATSITCTPTCTDGDSDGYYLQSGCGAGAVDCNDGDSSINPGRPEVCSDGIDNNCDGLVDDQDSGCNSKTTDPCPDDYPKQCGTACYPAGSVCCGGDNACEAGYSCCSGCIPDGSVCCGGGPGYCPEGDECCGSSICMRAGSVCCDPVGSCPPGCTCVYESKSCDCPNATGTGSLSMAMNPQEVNEDGTGQCFDTFISLR